MAKLVLPQLPISKARAGMAIPPPAPAYPQLRMRYNWQTGKYEQNPAWSPATKGVTARLKSGS